MELSPPPSPPPAAAAADRATPAQAAAADDCGDFDDCVKAPLAAAIAANDYDATAALTAKRADWPAALRAAVGARACFAVAAICHAHPDCANTADDAGAPPIAVAIAAHDLDCVFVLLACGAHVGELGSVALPPLALWEVMRAAASATPSMAALLAWGGALLPAVARMQLWKRRTDDLLRPSIAVRACVQRLLASAPPLAQLIREAPLTLTRAQLCLRLAACSGTPCTCGAADALQAIEEAHRANTAHVFFCVYAQLLDKHCKCV